MAQQFFHLDPWQRPPDFNSWPYAGTPPPKPVNVVFLQPPTPEQLAALQSNPGGIQYNVLPNSGMTPIPPVYSTQPPAQLQGAQLSPVQGYTAPMPVSAPANPAYAAPAPQTPATPQNPFGFNYNDIANAAIPLPRTTGVSESLGNGLWRDPNTGFVYDENTGHYIGHGFRAYWEQSGGLSGLGRPLTEEFSYNGTTYQVFENGVLAWVPGSNPAQFDVVRLDLPAASSFVQQHGAIAPQLLIPPPQKQYQGPGQGKAGALPEGFGAPQPAGQAAGQPAGIQPTVSTPELYQASYTVTTPEGQTLRPMSAVAGALDTAVGPLNPQYVTDKMRGVVQWLPIVLQVSEETGVPWEVIASHIAQESGGDPNARGAAGEQGLMQIMPAYWQSLANQYGGNLFDPYTNIRTGAEILKRLYQKFGNWDLVAWAYNAGEGNVDPSRLHNLPGYVKPYVESVRDFRFRWLDALTTGLQTQAGAEPAAQPQQAQPEQQPPAQQPDAPKPQTYVVQPGDTASAIAAKHGLSFQQFAALNPQGPRSGNWNLIYPGETFVVGPGAPPASKPQQPTPAAPTGAIDAWAIFGGNRYPITQEYGHTEFAATSGGYANDFHMGIDIGAPYGTPIYAPVSGTVTAAGWIGGYGYAVMLEVPGVGTIVFGHMAEPPYVAPGETVSAGTQIGIVGSTGFSTGPHLHLEVRPPTGGYRNPREVFAF